MGAWFQHVAGAAVEGPADQDDLTWDSLKSEASSGAEAGAGWESASLIAVEHLVSAERRGRLTVFQDRGVYFHQSKPSYRGPPIFARQSRVSFTSFTGLPGVSRTALKAVFQAACLVARCSSSASLGVLYPRAEWSRF